MGKVACKCGRRLSFKPEQRGNLAKCPICGAQIRLPGSKATESSQTKSEHGLDDLVAFRLARLPPEDKQPTQRPVPESSNQNERSASGLRLRDEPPLPSAPSIPPTPRVVPAEARQPEPRATSSSFWTEIPGAFVYPLTEDGLGLLLAGIIFFTIAYYIQFV